MKQRVFTQPGSGVIVLRHTSRNVRMFEAQIRSRQCSYRWPLRVRMCTPDASYSISQAPRILRLEPPITVERQVRLAVNRDRVRAGSKSGHVRFSNRPFRVKHFQTIRRCSVDVAHGLALLFGIGAKALPLWDSRMRWSNLCSGLAVRRNGRSKRTCELTSSIVPRGTSSTARWSSIFLLLDLIL